jgi:hypothetical protein
MAMRDSKDVPHSVFHLIHDQGANLSLWERYNLNACRMKVASSFVGILVANSLRAKSAAMFDEALHHKALRPTFGLAFEGDALQALAGGGQFPVRDVGEESSSRAVKNVTLRPRAVLPLDRQYVRSPSSLTESSSFLVPKAGFAVVDAMSVEGLFQVTLSPNRRHSAQSGSKASVSDNRKVGKGLVTRREAWQQLPALWCQMNVDVYPDWDGVRNRQASLPVYYVVPHVADAFDTFSVSERDMPASLTVKVSVGDEFQEIEVTLMAKVLRVGSSCDLLSSASDALVAKRIRDFAAELDRWEKAAGAKDK